MAINIHRLSQLLLEITLEIFLYFHQTRLAQLLRVIEFVYQNKDNSIFGQKVQVSLFIYFNYFGLILDTFIS
jgi:hypothetical protein